MSDFAKFIKEKACRENDRFFGEGNHKKISNKYYTFKHVLDNDTILINTNNIRVVKDSLILVVGDDKAVYLKDWNVRKAHNYDWGIDFWIVKLSRAFFKLYTFKSRIDNDLMFDVGSDLAPLGALTNRIRIITRMKLWKRQRGI